MSNSTSGLSDADVAQTTKNIALVRQFLREIVADPSRLDEMPSGATVVLLPSDDPEQLAANLALAEQATREGRNVYIRRAGGPATSMRVVALKWPSFDDLDPRSLTIALDQDRNTLTVSFARSRQTALRVPLDAASLLVNPATDEVEGLEIVVPAGHSESRR